MSGYFAGEQAELLVVENAGEFFERIEENNENGKITTKCEDKRA